MRYRAKPSLDFPNPAKTKRILFYRLAIKVYGVLPYLLNRQVQGDFRSNDNGIVFLSADSNYTVVPYGLDDLAIKALLSWLCADAGFEWGIAGPRDWNATNLRTNNANKPWPQVKHLVDGHVIEGYAPITTQYEPEVFRWLKGEIHDLDRLLSA